MHTRARLLERQAHCTCEIDLGSPRRRVFATHIRVGLVSCSGDNVEKVKGRMKGGAAGQGRSEEFLSADSPLLIFIPNVSFYIFRNVNITIILN